MILGLRYIGISLSRSRGGGDSGSRVGSNKVNIALANCIRIRSGQAGLTSHWPTASELGQTGPTSNWPTALKLGQVKQGQH